MMELSEVITENMILPPLSVPNEYLGSRSFLSLLKANLYVLLSFSIFIQSGLSPSLIPTVKFASSILVSITRYSSLFVSISHPLTTIGFSALYSTASSPSASGTDLIVSPLKAFFERVIL